MFFLSSSALAETPKSPLPIATIVAREEMVLGLTPRLKQCEQALVANSKMGLPFGEKGVWVAGLPLASSLDYKQWAPLEFNFLKLGEQETHSKVVPYQSLLDQWTSAQFGILSGDFLGDSQEQFAMECSFEGAGVLDERHFAIRGSLDLYWQKQDDSWFINKWVQKDLEAAYSESLLFREVLGELVDDPETLKTLRRSFHEEDLIASFKRGYGDGRNNRDGQLPDFTSNTQIPCASVVDFDQDGIDDLFVTSRLSGVHLLKNNGQGQLTDVTAKMGLSNIQGFATTATFADFDNDGDTDLFLGRSAKSSIYFENINGRYVDQTLQKLGPEKIYFVTCANAIDINRDGLLDLYIATYSRADGNWSAPWARRFYGPSDLEEIVEHSKNYRSYIDVPGPPSVVFINRGAGKLERVREPSPLIAFRSSLVAVWADFDKDGDADCYLCNDFAPDNFLRNDTPRGAELPVFVDVNEEVAAGVTMGFGMGASWGDYDSDGDLDLYISNMYSKAGKRIIKMIGPTVHNRIKASAQGNYLFENNGGKFKQVAGRGDDQIPVAKVGWSFGGQFADFDNDTQLDVYVPSGFFSAPQEIRTEIDL